MHRSSSRLWNPLSQKHLILPISAPSFCAKEKKALEKDSELEQHHLLAICNYSETQWSPQVGQW